VLHYNLGHYQVDDKIFFKKSHATFYANQNGKKDIQWVYHDEIFNALDWTHEPEISLDIFYRERAKQIREQFDYVILMCSGGADSTNMLLAFLQNNLKVDEIVIAAPWSGMNKWQDNAFSICPSNMISETNLTQIPLVKYVATQYPEIKITQNDYFQNILNFKPEEWIQDCPNFYNPSSSRNSLELLGHLKDLVDRGKVIAKVYGTDKPNLAMTESGNIYYVVQDFSISHTLHSSILGYDHAIIPVTFYWNHEIPQLMIKQAHIVANWIFKPENSEALKYLWKVEDPKSWSFSVERISKYQNRIIPAIYPKLQHRQVFQTLKTINTEVSLLHDKIWLKEHHQGLDILNYIYEDIEKFFSSVDEKYRSSKWDLLPIKKWWKIGNKRDFYPTKL
jgi:hypothetical protein